jgi:hypothetical protein
LAKETYLQNTGEMGLLGKSIMELGKWIVRLYDFGIMNLLDIPHFGHSEKIELCIKKLVA